MKKKTIFRILNLLFFICLISSCASIKKSSKSTSISEPKLTPATKAGTNGFATGEIQTLNADQFNKLLLLNGVQLVDVRTKEEFQTGHIQDALNIDVKDANFKSAVKKLDKNNPVLVYCKSGIRSGNAAEILKEMGFNKIVSLDGGILSWEKADLPIIK